MEFAGGKIASADTVTLMFVDIKLLNGVRDF